MTVKKMFCLISYEFNGNPKLSIAMLNLALIFVKKP